MFLGKLAKFTLIRSLGIIITLHIAGFSFSQTIPNFNFKNDSLHQTSYSDEMQKVLDFYAEDQNDFKRKAALFLLSNIHLHYTQSYFWMDSTRSKIEFDETQYKDFRTSIRAFESLKSQYGSLKAQPVIYSDYEHLNADYLVKMIDLAFEQYGKQTFDEEEFNIFCEYYLPYRIAMEPLFEWREKYRDRFSRIIGTSNSMSLVDKVRFLKDNINLWFICTYNLEMRSDPLPRLGSLQLLHRKKGTCEDVAALAVFALRSVGTPCTIDVVPYWATSTGGHSLNTAFDSTGSPYHFDVLSLTDSLHEFIREPAKVFRLTYSENKESLASKIPINEIPPYGMLRDRNYIDVTEEYWPVRDIEAPFSKDSVGQEVIYACVFNGNKWRPVWWGKAKDSSVTFTNMSKGTVILPKYYEGGKLKAAGYPVASGYNGVQLLKPSEETHTIRIKELENYLKFKTGMLYKLYYYDHRWKKIGQKIPDDETTTLFFHNVPKNALLILKPSNSNGKERPFIITESGQRLWW